MVRTPDPRHLIDYERTFIFAAPLDQVWNAVLGVDRFPHWWHWLQDFHVEGEPLEAGTVLRGIVVPPVPYRMRLRVEIDDAKTELYIAARVHGDLDGVARIDFEPLDECTRVIASWNVEIMQAPMRLAATLGAGRLLKWGHDRVVDMTVAGFKRRL